MKPTIAFLVKNGIGFGHLRRALLIAEALQAQGGTRPVIISQASSIDLFATTTVPVVNFPMLQHLPNDIAADWYTEVLTQLLHRLDPALIVEDTYPDPRYLNLAALADRPRVLVLRRLDGLSMDTIRASGRLAAYDKILIAQDAEAFADEGHSGVTQTAVQVSGRFEFVGQIYRSPDQATVAAIRDEYRQRGQRLIVVNGGAGGDQMPDGYGDRLFHACDQVAERLHRDGVAAHFVFVTGPYYAGRPLHERSHVTVRGFEPLLPEYLAAADVAIIKPGHNGVSEALCGSGHLILVPDVSFMEGLGEHSRRIAARYGGAVAGSDADLLGPLVRNALHTPPRTESLGSGDKAIARAAAVLAAMATDTTPVTLPGHHVLLLLRPPGAMTPEVLRELLPTELCGALVIGADIQTLTADDASGAAPGVAVLVDTPPAHPDPAAAIAAGVWLVLGRRDDIAFERWRRLPVPGPALLTAHVTTAIADPARPQRLYRHLRRTLEQQHLPAVELDLRRLRDPDEVHGYLAETGSWLAKQPLELVSIEQAAAILGQQLLAATQ